MLKHLLLGAVATTLIGLSGAANAATLTVTDLGTANPSATYPLLSANSLVLGVNNAPIVFGGGDNNGTIQGTNGSNAFNDSTTYTDGTTGWNPFGTNSQNYWISIAGEGGVGFDNAGASSVTLGFQSPQYSLQFVWGSPSYNNSVALYDSGFNLLGTVQQTGSSGALDVFDGSGNYLTTFDDANLQDTDSPGQIIKIASDNPFAYAVLTSPDNTGGFEVGGISAVPLPGAMPMFGAALLGLGLLSRRRKSVIA